MPTMRKLTYESEIEYISLGTATTILSAFNSIAAVVPEATVNKLIDCARSLEENPLLIGVRIDGERFKLNASKMVDDNLFFGKLQEIAIPPDFLPDGISPYKLSIPPCNVTALRLGRQSGFGMLEVHYLDPNAEGEGSMNDLWDTSTYFQGLRLVVE